jgi:hypothetical protein
LQLNIALFRQMGSLAALRKGACAVCGQLDLPFSEIYAGIDLD